LKAKPARGPVLTTLSDSSQIISETFQPIIFDIYWTNLNSLSANESNIWYN